MPDECRPPDGTPDGAFCWVRNAKGEWSVMRWDNIWGGRWFVPWCSINPGAQGLLADGWRFHSFAEVPHD